MLITVAICTYNRAKSLSRTLESLAAMRLPDKVKWEVVVVNNNSIDGTEAVIASYANRLPIRREFEVKQGLSHARNRAIDAAGGDYIIWTDDDVVVDREWLAAYSEAFDKQPEAALFGGAITPRYEPPVPSWISESAALIGGWAFSARDFGDCSFPLRVDDGRLPYGPNFAVRGDAQRSFRYDPELGHAPSQRRRGEELDVIERILSTGATGYWVPHARVEHCVSQEQQTLEHITDIFNTIGEAEAARRRVAIEDVPCLFGAPRYLWRTLAESWLRYRFYRLLSSPNTWLPYLRDYAIRRGVIAYWRDRRHTGS